jgi:hypothetical protein
LRRSQEDLAGLAGQADHAEKPTGSEPDVGSTKHPEPIDVFVSYCHQDEPLWTALAKHLKPMERERLIRVWHDRKLTSGSEIDQVINAQLDRAGIILLLVSPDFVSSEYCWSKEMRRALDRHEAGEALAVPVILRPVDWHHTPFAKLLALPKDGTPITSWKDPDDALLDVARGIRTAAGRLLRPVSTETSVIEVLSNLQMDSICILSRGKPFASADERPSESSP